MEMIKHAKRAYLTVSAATIVLGLVLVLFPAISMRTLCYLTGGVMAVFGIVRLAGYFSKDLFRLAFQFDLALGIFCLLAGVLFLIHPDGVLRTVPTILGLFTVIDGVFKLQTALDARRFGLKRWYGILALAILTCAFGVCLLFDPFGGGKALIVLLGLTLIIDGIQNLCVVLYTVRTARKSGTKPPDTIETERYREL